MKILYEDKSIIVVSKPKGLATQSANISQKDCLSLVKKHLKQDYPEIKGEPYVGVINRLDQPVSGLVIFAKTAKAAAILSRQIQTDIMNKKYHAVVEGRVADKTLAENSVADNGKIDAKKGIFLENYIYKDSRSSKAVICDDKNKAPKDAKLQKAALSYSVMNYYEEADVTLLDINLMTGRFHQIRAQLSNIGHPIVNDRKYGTGKVYMDGQIPGICIKGGIALEAYEISFLHPDTGKEMIFRIDE